MSRDTTLPKSLRDKLTHFLKQGTYLRPMEEVNGEIKVAKGFGGTGAVGMFAEGKIAARANNSDTADARGWEIKCTNGKSKISLSHKNAKQEGKNKEILNQHGYIGKNGEFQLRMPVYGNRVNKRGFSIVVNDKEGRVEMWVKGEREPIIYWDKTLLTNMIGRKLGRVVLITYKNIQDGWEYTQARLLSELDHEMFFRFIRDGIVSIEFDMSAAYEGHPAHDHGVKFRITPANLRRLYKHDVAYQ